MNGLVASYVATAPLAAPQSARVRARPLRAPLAVVIYAVFLAAIVLSIDFGSDDIVRALWHDKFVLGAVGGVLAAYVGWERRRPASLVALAAATIAAALWWSLALAGLWQPPSYAVLWVAGVVGLAAFGRRIAIATPRMRALWLIRARDALVIPCGVALTPLMLLASSQMVMVRDLHLLAFEDTLGPRFSQLTVAAFLANPLLAEVSLAAYYLLPAGVALAMAALERTRPPLDPLLAFAALTAVGYVLYWLFPVVGPRQLFGPFPFAFPPAGGFEIAAVELRTIAPRNGMPSLHTAWALMIWFVAAGAGPRLRLTLRLFAALNIAATMGAEDPHWITDLVVAVPLTVAVCAAAMLGVRLRGPRLLAIAVGAVTTAAAMALLFYAVPLFQAKPVLSWVFVAATMVPSLVINARLWRAVQEPRPSWAT